jgi:hypothetical protein
VRISLLFTTLIAIYFYHRFYFRWILYASFLLLIVPFFLLQTSLYNKQSVFEKYLSKINNTELKTDTRTFLYIELLEDLTMNNELVVGKGSNGTYYSSFFRNINIDTENRLTIEVGILAILLKGGLIASFLNLGILFSTIYLSFFRSNNIYVLGIGFMLLIHTLLLFVENLVSFSTYNFVIWFFIGVGLSKKIRSLDNTEIRKLLNYRE